MPRVKTRNRFKLDLDPLESRQLLTVAPHDGLTIAEHASFVHAMKLVADPHAMKANPNPEIVASRAGTPFHSASRATLAMSAVPSLQARGPAKFEPRVGALSVKTGAAVASVPTVSEQSLTDPSNPFVNLPVLSQSSLQPGDILLTTESADSSKFIRTVSFSAFSHASIYIGNGKIVDATSDGVKVRSLGNLTAKAIRTGVIRVNNLTSSQSAVVLQTAQGLVGKPYNYVGLVLGGITELIPIYRFYRLVTGNPLKLTPSTIGPGFFCSELVIKAFGKAGIKIAPESGDTPGGILTYAQANSSKFSLVGQLTTPK